MPRLSEQVRARLRAEMKQQKVSQRTMAGLTNWTQSRVAHLLTGRTVMGVDDLESFAFALGLRVPELVRDPGFEFCAEMTPTELRLFERLRTLTPSQRDGIIALLQIPKAEPRRALPKKPDDPKRFGL